MRISNWSSDVCSSDLRGYGAIQPHQTIPGYQRFHVGQLDLTAIKAFSNVLGADQILMINEIGFTQIYDLPNLSRLQLETGDPNRTHHSRSEEHTSELQSLMRISYAVFCLKKKNHKLTTHLKKHRVHNYT